MVSTFTIVSLLWNAARSVGAAAAASQAETAFELGTSIAKLAARLWKTNNALRELGGENATEEDLTESQRQRAAEILADEGITFTVQAQDFSCHHAGDFT